MSIHGQSAEEQVFGVGRKQCSGDDGCQYTREKLSYNSNGREQRNKHRCLNQHDGGKCKQRPESRSHLRDPGDSKMFMNFTELLANRSISVAATDLLSGRILHR